MPLISFIIPVYNAQRYLEECLASILMQTRKDYEIILVDDCSRDRSGTICDIYAQKYEAITVIHLTENQGPGGARNIGLTKANGKYIHFMDSDDLIVRNFVENITEVIQHIDVDILHFQHEHIAADDKLSSMFVAEKENIELISSDRACQLLLPISDLQISAWRLVIKRELLLRHNITFLCVQYGEDAVFYLKTILSSENIIFLQEKYYFYRINAEGSLTQKVSIEEKNVFLSCIKVVGEFLECDSRSEMQKALKDKLIKHYLGDAFRLLYCLQEDEEVLRSVEVLLEKHQDYFEKHSHDIALSTLIQEYGVHDGLMRKLHSLNEALENATNFYKKPYIFIMPASKPNVAVAKRLEKCGACVKGYLDNNPQKAQKVISNGSVYSPAILQEISSKEDIAIIISSSRDEVEQALVKQMKEEYLLDDIQLFCLK